MKKLILMPIVTLMLVNALSHAACAATPMTPQSSSPLAVRVLPTAEARIVQTSARQDGEELVVAGRIQRKKVHGRVIPKGHIDITILDKEGRTMHQTSTRYAPEILPRMDGVKSSFTVRIPMVAPLGGLVRVKYDSGPQDS